MNARFPILAILVAAAPLAMAAEAPDADALEAGRYVIRTISLDKADVFDLSDAAENNWLYRAANRFHVVTRDKTINKQLLFGPGDLYNKRLVEETERLLRQNKYLYDASIEAAPATDGTVDLTVHTKDVWSLAPELSVSRSGGETRSRIGLEETNLLGRGQLLRVLRDNDIDRSENVVEFADQRMGSNWWSLLARYSNNSDGDAHWLNLVRPFYALDARWAAGGSLLQDDRRDKLYQLGEESAEYRHERDYAWLFGGWSRGLQNGKARRWTAGVVYDDHRFSDVPTSALPSVVPDNRRLVYPFIGIEIVEDGYVKTQNRDQIERTEDFQMGLQGRASIGWADTSLGSDRDAAMFSADVSRGFGSLDDTALLLAARTSGRVESGDFANALISFSARYYRIQSEKRTFYAGISGTAGESLDLDNQVELGGKTGLRGYPLRYQVGESKMLATIEQRYYTDWYPFRLARVGAAIFADAGRVWGPNALGPDHRDWLVDVGFGLRFALTRVASGRVVHLDIAFPLNGDESIDEVQFLLESRKSF